MESISERIESVIKELGYNKNSFSKAIGLGNNVTIGRIINEKRDPSYEVLQKIIQTFGHIISAKWLVTGDGQMKINPASYADISTIHEPMEAYSTDDIKKILANLEFLAESMTSELKKLKEKIS
jgi:transcriptional regulator with XRE-family HTH domain